MLKKAMENINGFLVTFTKDITKMINDISMEKCTGMMGASIKVNGVMVCSMDMEK